MTVTTLSWGTSYLSICRLILQMLNQCTKLKFLA